MLKTRFRMEAGNGLRASRKSERSEERNSKLSLRLDFMATSMCASVISSNSSLPRMASSTMAFLFSDSARFRAAGISVQPMTLVALIRLWLSLMAWSSSYSAPRAATDSRIDGIYCSAANLRCFRTFKNEKPAFSMIARGRMSLFENCSRVRGFE